jgi:hypothetical protein
MVLVGVLKLRRVDQERNLLLVVVRIMRVFHEIVDDSHIIVAKVLFVRLVFKSFCMIEGKRHFFVIGFISMDCAIGEFPLCIVELLAQSHYVCA